MAPRIETQLRVAVDNDDVKRLRMLLKAEKDKGDRGIDLTRKVWKRDGAALQLAAANGNNNMIKLLIRAGFDVDSFCVDTPNRWTALHAAAANNNTVTVKMLLDKFGADATLEGRDDDLEGTAAQWAKRSRHPHLAKILEEHVAAKSGDPFQIIMDKIKNYPAKKAELAAAMSIKAEIDAKKKERAKIDAEIAALEADAQVKLLQNQHKRNHQM